MWPKVEFNISYVYANINSKITKMFASECENNLDKKNMQRSRKKWCLARM